jgi:hypothetical protein
MPRLSGEDGDGGGLAEEADLVGERDTCLGGEEDGIDLPAGFEFC